MKVLRVQFNGFSASFRIPFAITGVQVSLPLPSYPNILGIISCCAGRNIETDDTLIGFEFEYQSKALDMERFNRWDFNLGKPKPQSKGPAVRKREFLINPSLTLYLSNLDFSNCFRFPNGIPTLGRSQDLAWIECIDQIELKPTQSGKIGGTLIPSNKFNQKLINGFIIRLPEYMEYDEEKRLRYPKNLQTFLATNSLKNVSTDIELDSGLYSSKDFKESQRCIYLHDWK